ncbi:unnamed protein product [Urochloa humidicola]
MKKQQILLHLHVLLVFSILMVAAAAAEDPQPVQSTRSLLQAAAPKIDCPSTCLARCGRNWKNEMCNKMCNVCCNRCNCVPPGTGQETRHLCPCYDTMKNPRTGKLKCP